MVGAEAALAFAMFMARIGIGNLAKGWREGKVQFLPVAAKKLPKPAWYKNTYFWIAGILFVLFIVGLVGGDATIRDPGQTRESYLWLLYLIASGIMLLNGLMSHAQTVQNYKESAEGTSEE